MKKRSDLSATNRNVWAIRVGTLIATVMLAWVSSASAGMKIYYLRHAEVGSNVEDQWKDKPRETWPPYVGHNDIFTPLGEEQVAAVAEKLRPYHFDFIAASPVGRARQTILPYLKTTHQRAEIWPELAEFKPPGHSPLPAELPATSATLFTGGRSIVLSAEERDVFTLRPDALREMKLGLGDDSQMEAYRRAAAAKIVAMLEARFGKTDKSILLVGHGTSGRYLANYLIKSAEMEVQHPANVCVWMAEQQADGSYRLVTFDDKPFAPKSSTK